MYNKLLQKNPMFMRNLDKGGLYLPIWSLQERMGFSGIDLEESE